MSGMNGHALDVAPLAAPATEEGVRLEVGLDAITLTFPATYWADPSHNIVLPNGTRAWQHRITEMVQLMGASLVKKLDDTGVLREDGSLHPPRPAIVITDADG